MASRDMTPLLGIVLFVRSKMTFHLKLEDFKRKTWAISRLEAFAN
jgi:hypothetical protein